MTGPDPVQATLLLLVLAGGTGLGYLHFATLHAVSIDYLGGHPVRAVLAQLARLAIMVTALVLLVRLGALYLLGGAAGVLAGRFLVMHRMGRKP